MKFKIILITSICLLLNSTACYEEHHTSGKICNTNINKELTGDSMFLLKLEQKYEKFELVNVRVENHIWNKTLFNRINLQLYYGFFSDNYKYLVVVKEILSDTINRLYSEFDDMNLYQLPEYDSLEYDRELMNFDIYDTQYDYSFTFKLSHQFWNIHKIMEANEVFQENTNKADDIKSLEILINNMSIIQQNRDVALNIIKQLYKVCIIKTINWYPNRYNEYMTWKYFNKLIFEIDSKDDLDSFQNSFYGVRGVINSPSKISLVNKWNIDNNKFLIGKINSIKEDYFQDDVFYFYTYPDKKLFKLTIEENNGKYILSSEFINKEYMWLDAENGIPPFRAYF